MNRAQIVPTPEPGSLTPATRQWQVHPAVVLRFALVAVAVIVGISLAVTITGQLWPDMPLGSLLDDAFSTDSEQSIGTVYSVLQLAVAAVAAAAVAVMAREQRRPWHRAWFGVSFCLAAVGLDEVLMLHERLNDHLLGDPTIGDRTSGEQFPWVYPAVALCLVLGFVFLRFVLALPPKVRYTVIVSAVLFVTGAAGMEEVGGRWTDVQEFDVVSVLIINVEEFFELVAIALMLYAIALFATTELDPERVVVSIGSGPPSVH